MDTSSAMMFELDTTVRWSCRAGNCVFWFSWRSIFAAPESGLAINDVWEMKDGDFVTITNRVPDMPEWFTLHPTEVCNSLSYPKKGIPPRRVMSWDATARVGEYLPRRRSGYDHS